MAMLHRRHVKISCSLVFKLFWELLRHGSEQAAASHHFLMISMRHMEASSVAGFFQITRCEGLAGYVRGLLKLVLDLVEVGVNDGTSS